MDSLWRQAFKLSFPLCRLSRFSGEQIYGRGPVLGQTPLAKPENEASPKLPRPYINRNLLSVFHRFKKSLTSLN